MGSTRMTAKMQAAVNHYALHRNKADAYRHAYNTQGMKPATISDKGTKLFNHHLVVKALGSLGQQVSEQTGIDAAWLLVQLSKLAKFNINRFLVMNTEGDYVYDFSQATDDDWYCISEYTTSSVGKGRGKNQYLVSETKLKAESKLKALELIGKHIGVQAFKEQLEMSGSVELIIASDESEL